MLVRIQRRARMAGRVRWIRRRARMHLFGELGEIGEWPDFRMSENLGVEPDIP